MEPPAQFRSIVVIIIFFNSMEYAYLGHMKLQIKNNLNNIVLQKSLVLYYFKYNTLYLTEFFETS